MGSRHRRVVWTEGAVRDLEAAVSFVAAESPENALRLLDKILDAAESLRVMSERGRIVVEQDDPDTRQLLVDSFRLLYRVAKSEVAVLGLLHQRRDFERWQGSDDAASNAP